APICEERAAADGLALRGIAAWTQRVAWRSADYALPVTDVLADYLRRDGVPDHRIVVVPNGIDHDKFIALPDRESAKRRLGLDSRLVLGFTGFVRPWNSLDRVVDLLAGLGDTFNLHLLLVGDGPARREVEERARSAGVIHRVTFTGIVPREAVASHVAAFVIALQPGAAAYAAPRKL